MTLLQLLQSTVEKTTKSDLENNYLKWTNNVTKWTCYSDYCFDDKNKPNDVVCFTIIPYVDTFEKLSNYIKTIASVDIKKTRKVSTEFINFLKAYPLINFSFIISDRKKILSNDHEEVKSFLREYYATIRQQYNIWVENHPEKKDYYDSVIKKLNCINQLIFSGKKIKQIVSSLLVTFLGAYVSSLIIQGMEIENFGWFSDRDALNEVCENSSIDLFYYYLHTLTDGQRFEFAASPAGSDDDPFYEELVRIPDYVAGALADYNMENDLISKDKFDTMLTEYMAENVTNNFVFHLYRENDTLYCSRITIHKS